MGAVLGSEPLMLEGPIPVTNKALRNAKMNASDIDHLRLMKLCSGSNAFDGSFYSIIHHKCQWRSDSNGASVRDRLYDS
jgi:hypothetical protein